MATGASPPAATGVAEQQATAHGGRVYRPFIDPIDVHATWFLTLIPLAVFIAIAYKAIRIPDPKQYWFHVLKMSVQIVLFVVLLGTCSYVFVEWLVPALAPLPE